MKLPRLSRKQKVIRNLLAAALLLFVTWGLREFAAPTPGLALRWKAETYGLPEPQVLYRTEWDNDRQYLVFRSGDVLAVNPKSEEDYFDWDETYTMEAVPNGHGVYRFLPEWKYTDDGVEQRVEASTMYRLSNNIRRGPQVDFACDVTVTFYDEQGEVVHTYEEALAEARYHTKPDT